MAELRVPADHAVVRRAHERTKVRQTMVKRRKFLVGMGALAAGSAASLGTGAFTNASIPDRQVTVNVDDDANSQIALVPGNDPDISLSSGGEIQLDLTGADSEGTNINSTYTWGDPSDPASDHAFEIVNNDDAGENYMMTMEYHFDDISWVDERQGQSFIEFQVYDNNPDAPHTRTYPDQRGSYNKDYSLAVTHSASSYKLNPGESWYVVVSVDTTGQYASTGDALSGNASFEFAETGLSETSWNDGW